MRFRKVFAGVTLAIGLAGCGGGDEEPVYTITYTSTSSAGAPVDATYATLEGMAQSRAATGTFTYSRSARAGDYLYLSGQNESALGPSQITSTILVNGQPFRALTTNGTAGTVATVTGICC